MKHLKFRQKYSAASCIFITLHVSSGNETLCLMLDILHEIPFVPLLQVFKYVF